MGVEEAKGGTRNRKDSEDVRGTLTAWRYNQQESCTSFFIWQPPMEKINATFHMGWKSHTRKENVGRRTKAANNRRRAFQWHYMRSIDVAKTARVSCVYFFLKEGTLETRCWSHWSAQQAFMPPCLLTIACPLLSKGHTPAYKSCDYFFHRGLLHWQPLGHQSTSCTLCKTLKYKYKYIYIYIHTYIYIIYSGRPRGHICRKSPCF